MGFPDDSVLKNLPANAGGIRDAGLIRSGRFPGGGNGNPLQYSCVGNPMDRGTWWATVHSIAKSQTQFSKETTSTCFYSSGALDYAASV